MNGIKVLFPMSTFSKNYDFSYKMMGVVTLMTDNLEIDEKSQLAAKIPQKQMMNKA